MTSELILLKFGGSLITDKDKPYTARIEKLASLAREVKAVLDSQPELRLVLGHGSGSFGHVAAKKYGTRDGVHTREQWHGFAEVRFQAAELNRLVMQSLIEAGLPAVPFPPSSTMIARDGRVAYSNLAPMRTALQSNLLPVVHGDVAFDEVRGGTILSTEDVFASLARELSASRILLAGIEAGVWEDFPARTKLVREIRSRVPKEMQAGIGASASTDVTGGMKAKVDEMLALVQTIEGLSAQIFAAEEEGQLTRALQGENIGTLIRA